MAFLIFPGILRDKAKNSRDMYLIIIALKCCDQHKQHDCLHFKVTKGQLNLITTNKTSTALCSTSNEACLVVINNIDVQYLLYLLYFCPCRQDLLSTMHMHILILFFLNDAFTATKKLCCGLPSIAFSFKLTLTLSWWIPWYTNVASAVSAFTKRFKKLLTHSKTH